MSNNSTQEIAPTLKLRVTGTDLIQLMTINKKCIAVKKKDT